MKKASGRSAFRLSVNLLLVVFGLMTIYSGLALQLGFHVGGGHGQNSSGQTTATYIQLRSIDTERQVSGLTYPAWAATHKAAVTVFTILVIAHCLLHLKWYQQVFSKFPFRRNTVAVIITILFLFVAISGFWPWITDLTGGNISVRMFLIEVHDKIAILFGIFLLFHFIRRISWYKNRIWKSR